MTSLCVAVYLISLWLPGMAQDGVVSTDNSSQPCPASTPSIWPHGNDTPEDQSRLGDLLAQAEEEEKKKRVPKKEKEETKQDVEDDEDDDEDPCMGFLSGCLISMFRSDSGDDAAELDEPTTRAPEPPPHDTTTRDAPPGEAPPEEHPWTGQDCVINPPAAETIAVPVWNAPGGEAGGGAVVDTLWRGNEARVTGSANVYDSWWLSVSPADSTKSSGWVAADHVSLPPEPMTEPWPETTPETAPEATIELLDDRTPIVPFELPPWQLSLELSRIGAFDSSGELDAEYPHGGLRVALGGRHYPVGSLFLSLDYSYTYEDGNPRFNFIYPDSAQVDIPTDSEIQTHALRFLVGVALPLEHGKTRISLGAGPSVVRVQERAAIKFEELDEGVVVRTGNRRDSLTKWKVGFGLEIGASHFVSREFSIGANLGLLYVPWDSAEEASLALDWLEDEGFSLFHVGATVRYSVF